MSQTSAPPAEFDPRWKRRAGVAVLEHGLPALPGVLDHTMSVPVAFWTAARCAVVLFLEFPPDDDGQGQPLAPMVTFTRDSDRWNPDRWVVGVGWSHDPVANPHEAEHPEREHARGLFMQALYQAGRHTDALDVFRSWRRHLAEELGLDPSPALQRIEQDILRHAVAAPDTRSQPANHAVAVLAERLLRRTRNVVLLATSRERLEVDGEHVWQVRPLQASGPRAPAVQLFLDRARAADPAADLPATEVAAVATLCARLDGLPLAIELAAARLPGTTVSELSGNLQDRFGLFTVGRRTDSRHHSLRAVVDWSYEQLTPAEQALFGQLSVFGGSFDAAAARAVAARRDDAGEVTRTLLRLVDCSLITADLEGGVTRYRLLETLRSYGLERLSEHAKLDAARARHARWAADLVTLAAAGLCGADEARWAGTLERHFSDLRAAHSWLAGQDTELSLRMVAELHWYALWRCQSEVFRWADVSAAAAAGSRLPFYPDALTSAAIGAVYRGDMQAAGTAARAALDSARGLDPINARRPLEALGEVAIFRGELSQASDLYRKAYDLSIGNGDLLDAAWDAAWDAASGAAADAYDNRLAEASRLADQARAAADLSGSPSAQALVSWVSGEIAASTSPSQARRHLERAVTLARPAGSRLIDGLSRVTLATLHARHGDPGIALDHYGQVIREWQQAGAWTPLWVTIRTPRTREPVPRQSS